MEAMGSLTAGITVSWWGGGHRANSSELRHQGPSLCLWNHKLEQWRRPVHRAQDTLMREPEARNREVRYLTVTQ